LNPEKKQTPPKLGIPISLAGFCRTEKALMSLAECKVECKVDWMNPTIPKLTKAPVVQITGQVRFSPVLAIESLIPEIQSELRKKGFPKFEKAVGQSLIFPIPGNPTSPPIEYQSHFIDRDNSQIVVLTASGVTLNSFLNQTAAEFDDVLLKIATTIQKIVEPELILRIGLRYLNVIQPSDAPSATTGLSKYVREGLMGIPLEQAGAKSSAWQIFSVSETEHGILVLRVRHPVSENFVPPDLFLGPNVKMRPLQPCSSLVLDLDHFAELNLPFHLEPIQTTLSAFHTVLDNAFTSAVKEFALAEWR
jgi:uncharacterized protein (TIGR04255 family)